MYTLRPQAEQLTRQAQLNQRLDGDVGRLLRGNAVLEAELEETNKKQEQMMKLLQTLYKQQPRQPE